MIAYIHFAASPHGPFQTIRVPAIQKDLGTYVLWGRWRLVRRDTVTIAGRAERVQILNN